MKTNLPTGWKYAASSSQAHTFDFHLTRLNAIHPNTPSTPTLNGTLTAINDPGGTLPNCLAANAPRIVYTLVGANDYNELLAAPECPQVALIGNQNAYSLQLPGSVPTGIFKARIGRGYFAGPVGIYFWDQDVVVTPGSAFAPIIVRQPDANLRRDISPPSWMSALVPPEFACEFALAFATAAGSSNPLGFGLAGVPAGGGALQFGAANMLSPNNVLCGPSSGFVGMGNSAGTAQFGVSTITGANTQTYAPGAIQTANMAAANIQGFAGASGLQCRVTSVLNGSCIPTLTYTYLAAATGQTVQSATLLGSAFASSAVGSLATFAVPAGQLVLSVSAVSISGSATSGAFVVEPSIRAY